MSTPERVGQGRTMVFHAPYPLGERAGSGSGVRPVKMRQAFADLGYEVIEVTGYGTARQRATRELARRLRDRLVVDFAYGENSTMPTLLTEPHHLPTHPLVDLRLLWLLRRAQIPTGLFYRDIYWRFPEYTERVPKVIAAGTRTLYHLELYHYSRWLDRVYLPSAQIASQVPHLRPGQTRPLPPGGVIVDQPRTEGPFTILYVGNLSAYYRMQVLFQAVAATPDVHLIVCTPAESWAAVRDDYAPWLGERVEVVHEHGDGLRPLFARADVCSLVVEPSEYRDFASPVKLYEYLGHGKPVIASAGTLSGQTVADGGLGWQVPYDADALASLLRRLTGDPAEVAALTEEVRQRRQEHTWVARARAVAEDLRVLDRRT